MTNPFSPEHPVKRSLTLTAAALVLSAATATAASAQVVTDVTGTTLTGGTLSITGVGTSLALSGTPGSVASNLGGTALTVSDLRGTAAGWSVTATYAAPASGLLSNGVPVRDITGKNVLVSAGGVAPDLLGGVSASNVDVVTDQPLTSAVTIATTDEADGSGITAMTAGLKVRIPVTAKVGDIYGGKVTFTVASVR